MSVTQLTGKNIKDASVDLTHDVFGVLPPANGGFLGHFFHVREEQASGTDGGSATSGSWQTRVLNTIVTNVGSNVTSLSSNRFTLAAGTYILTGYAPANKTGNHQARIQNITDSTTVGLGQNANATSASNGITLAVVHCYLTIASSKAFELQHRVASSHSTDGLGQSGGWGTEVYGTVIGWRIA